VEHGMKVFTAVYRRLYRSLAEEFKKVFELNGKYLDPNKYVSVLDMVTGPNDFDSSTVDIFPGADPTATSQNEKLTKAQGLMELMQMFPGVLDPLVVITRILEAQEQPNARELFSKEVQESGQLPPPPPDPKMQALQMKAQIDQQKAASDIQQQQQEMELEGRSKEQQMQMSAQEHALKMQQQAQSGQLKAASELQKARIHMATASAQGQQKLVQGHQQHQVKMQQAKELKSSSPTSNGKNGGKTQ